MMEESSSKVDRQKAVSEPNTRELLRRLVVDQKALVPEVSPEGLLHYPAAEAVLGSEAEVRAWIAQMLDLGILRESGRRELVVCPTHFRVDPLVQLECAKCKSRHMRKSTLVEHIFCGFIESDTKFIKDGLLVCPNCKRPIRKPEELKNSGIWFECRDCSTKTSAPKMVFTCRQGHEFGTLELALASSYTYEVDASVVAQLRNTLVLAPALASMLTSLGYEVSCPASVEGRSGTKQSLDVYAKNELTDIALQISVDTKPIEPTAIISFFAKTYDIKPKLSVLVTIPSASEAARQINAGYDIVLVEDVDGSGAVQKVKDLLLSRATK